MRLSYPRWARQQRHRRALFLLVSVLGWSLAEPARGEGSPARDLRISDTRNMVVEAAVAAHPTKAGSLLVTASEHLGDRGWKPRAYISDDFGKTWHRPDLPGTEQTGKFINNQVLFAPWGDAYLSTMFHQAEAGVFRSTDGGRTWSRPRMLPRSNLDMPVMAAALVANKPWLYVSGSGTGARNGHLVAAPADVSVLPVFASRDHGNTFELMGGYVGGNNLGHQALGLIATEEGALHLTLVEYLGRSSNQARSSRVFVATSTDQGRSFLPDRLIGDVLRPFVHPVAGALFARMPRKSSERPAQSRWQSDQMVAVWPGGDRESVEVSFSSSQNGGQTWSHSSRLDRPGRHSPHQPAVAVSNKGVIGVTWLQMAPGAGACTETYFAASFDGGKSFSPGRPISSVAACATHKANLEWPIADRAPGGEYIGLTALADGSFFAVWCDGRFGPYQVIGARVFASPEGVSWSPRR